MTKKKTTKSKLYPIEWAQNGGGKEDFMDAHRITRQVRRLADDARSTGKRWNHALWQVSDQVIVLVMVEIAKESWGVYLAYGECTADTEKAALVNQLRRELRHWIKEHDFEPQPAKQLEEVKR